MVKDAANTDLLVLEGDMGVPASILRIEDGAETDTLVFGVDEGWAFWGGDISVDPIHTDLENGSLFSAYVKDSEGNTVESFEDEPLVFECIEYWDPWGESMERCNSDGTGLSSAIMKACSGFIAISALLLNI